MACDMTYPIPKRSLLSRVAGRLRTIATGRVDVPPQLAIVIPLPDEIAHEVVDLQLSIFKQHGAHDGLESQPHITLKMGFPATDIPAAAAFLEQQAARMRTVPIEIDGFDTFGDGILFLDVKPNPALESMRQGLLHDLKSAFGFVPLPVEGPGFRFHVTIAAGLPAGDITRLRAAFNARGMSFQFMARQIDLIFHTGSHWVLCRRLALPATDERS